MYRQAVGTEVTGPSHRPRTGTKVAPAPLRQMLFTTAAWWLQHPETPATHLHPATALRPKTIIEESIGPALYDRAFSTEENIGIQQGWNRL